MIYMNTTKTISQTHMMKELTPPSLRLLDPASNELTLPIILKRLSTLVYNSQTSLKPT